MAAAPIDSDGGEAPASSLTRWAGEDWGRRVNAASIRRGGGITGAASTCGGGISGGGNGGGISGGGRGGGGRGSSAGDAEADSTPDPVRVRPGDDDALANKSVLGVNQPAALPGAMPAVTALSMLRAIAAAAWPVGRAVAAAMGADSNARVGRGAAEKGRRVCTADIVPSADAEAEAESGAATAAGAAADDNAEADWTRAAGVSGSPLGLLAGWPSPGRFLAALTALRAASAVCCSLRSLSARSAVTGRLAGGPPKILSLASATFPSSVTSPCCFSSLTLAGLASAVALNAARCGSVSALY